MRGLKSALGHTDFHYTCSIVCVRCVDWNGENHGYVWSYESSIVCVRCVDWNLCRISGKPETDLVASFAYDAWIEIPICFSFGINTKVASFAYDAWIEIDCMVRWSGFIESHRLRTMRGLKSLVRKIEWQSESVASFAYDAWIEMKTDSSKYRPTLSHRLRTMRGLKCRTWYRVLLQ